MGATCETEYDAQSKHGNRFWRLAGFVQYRVRDSRYCGRHSRDKYRNHSQSRLGIHPHPLARCQNQPPTRQPARRCITIPDGTDRPKKNCPAWLLFRAFRLRFHFHAHSVHQRGLRVGRSVTKACRRGFLPGSRAGNTRKSYRHNQPITGLEARPAGTIPVILTRQHRNPSAVYRRRRNHRPALRAITSPDCQGRPRHNHSRKLAAAASPGQASRRQL